MNPTPPQAAGSLNRFLNAIEAAGNKLPHITMLFIWALVITLVISLALSYVSFDYRHPSTGAVIAVTNMLAPANLLDLGKLFKNPCYQAGWNKNVPFSFS